MMKSANLQNGIPESVGKAETNAYPAEDAFPFGAYRMKLSVVWYGKAPLSACKVLAFSPKNGWYRGSIASRPDCFGTGVFLFPTSKRILSERII